jgi:DnaJ-domain-containing protein 1
MTLVVEGFLLGGLTVALIVAVITSIRARDSTHEEAQARRMANGRDPGGTRSDMPPAWSWHVGALDDEPPQASRRGSGVSEEHAAAQGDDSDHYRRRRPTWSPNGPRWNPYAEDQSRAQRARAARRRPRPHRPAATHDTSGTAATSVTYYERLGVERTAGAAELERAYRRCVATIHPDKFFDDPTQRRKAEEELKQLNMVMQVLRDPDRRAKYDSTLVG